jgi:hypothetical protein
MREIRNKWWILVTKNENFSDKKRLQKNFRTYLHFSEKNFSLHAFYNNLKKFGTFWQKILFFAFFYISEFCLTYFLCSFLISSNIYSESTFGLQIHSKIDLWSQVPRRIFRIREFSANLEENCRNSFKNLGKIWGDLGTLFYLQIHPKNLSLPSKFTQKSTFGLQFSDK